MYIRIYDNKIEFDGVSNLDSKALGKAFGKCEEMLEYLNIPCDTENIYGTKTKMWYKIELTEDQIEELERKFVYGDKSH